MDELNEYAEKAYEMFKEATKIPVLKFELTDSEPDIFSSKIGGTPYLSQNSEVPVDKRGEQMKFLAQFDCSLLSGLPDYPHTGMLQFWLSKKYPWVEHKVIYYEQIDKTVSDSDVISKIDSFEDETDVQFPVINGGYGITTHLTEESMSESDERCEEFLWHYLDVVTDGRAIDEYDDDISELIEVDYTSGHKIGGYLYDPQPRNSYEYDPDLEIDLGTDDEKLLLLQLEYDHGYGKNWQDNAKIIIGDCGVIHFFIKRKDLKQLNFDKVKYDWSCS